MAAAADEPAGKSAHGSAAGELWAYAAADQPDGHPDLTKHRDVAGILDALLPGDVVIAFLDPPRFKTQPAEDLKSLRVTFAARDATLERVARLINAWLRHRVEFVPRLPAERLTLTLDRVRLADVLAALAEHGEVKVFPPSAGRPPA